jgi:purine-nucleoside phosphorylase
VSILFIQKLLISLKVVFNSYIEHTLYVMATKKPRLTIYLASQEILDKLQAIAEEQQRSVSNLVSVALAEWIAEYERGKNK